MSREEPEHYKYDPELHPFHYTSWQECEHTYIIDNYGKIPLFNMSLSLGRTYRSVQRKIHELKKLGLISNVT